MDKVRLPKYTLQEELINSISHGVGAILAVVGLIFMLIKSLNNDSNYSFSSSLIYGTSLITLYTVSCIYHGLSPKIKAKKLMRILDHCSVFLLEAGTFTPICLITIGGFKGWIIFSFIWLITLLGIILNFFNVDKYQVTSVICHLLIGWSILLMMDSLYPNLKVAGLFLLITGGVFYSIGVFLYLLGSKKKYMHSIFHFFCLAGSLFHFFMIFSYII